MKAMGKQVSNQVRTRVGLLYQIDSNVNDQILNQIKKRIQDMIWMQTWYKVINRLSEIYK